MKQTIVNTGLPASQDTIKVAFDKVNSNFTDIYGRVGIFPEDYGYDDAVDQSGRDAAIQDWIDALKNSIYVGCTIPGKEYLVGSLITCAVGSYFINSNGVFKRTDTTTEAVLFQFTAATKTNTRVEIRVNGNTTSNANANTFIKFLDGNFAQDNEVHAINCDTAVECVGNYEGNRLKFYGYDCAIGIWQREESGNSPDENYYEIYGSNCRTYFKGGNLVDNQSAYVHFNGTEGGGQEYSILLLRGQYRITGLLRSSYFLLKTEEAVTLLDFDVTALIPGALVSEGDLDFHTVIRSNGVVNYKLNQLGAATSGTESTGVWLAKCQKGVLDINMQGSTRTDCIKIGEASVAIVQDVVGKCNVISLSGLVDVNLDNCERCRIDIGDSSKVSIGSGSRYNSIKTVNAGLTVTNSRTQKDNVITIDRPLTDAEVAALSSPINGYRLLAQTSIMTSGELIYIEGTGWVATRN